MRAFILATQNPGKIKELRAVLPDWIEVLQLPEEFSNVELPETHHTLEENALQKAHHVFESTGIPSIADDTGLEVKALNGRPGVLSARYAGPDKDSDANMTRLLEELKNVKDRTARFRTVIAVVGPNEEFTVEGTVEGLIADAPKGDGGFGYDPIFRPIGQDLTFAEMSLDEKAAISHRTNALHALVEKLK